MVFTAKCQGPAPLGVGTMTAMEPTMNVTSAQAALQMGSGVETEEREVVMEKVTAPDGKGEKNEQWHVAHVLHGNDSRPQTVEGVFHLIIYTQSAQDEEAQNDDRYGADNGHPPACFGKVGEYLVEAGACAVEEIGEDRQLPQKRDTRDDGHECGVDGPFGNHSA